jgi:hypothetical protein
LENNGGEGESGRGKKENVKKERLKGKMGGKARKIKAKRTR